MRGERNSGGLYIHVPFCDGKCGYCAFYSTLYEQGLADRFLAALELDLASLRLEAETVYIGGGTPSILSVSQLEKLCRAIHRHVSFKSGREWTVEMNPGTVSEEKLSVLVSAGANRISLGAQSFDDKALKVLGRRHSAADIASAVAMVRAAGIRNLSLDLIACTPGFGGKCWETNLIRAIGLAPEHISVYALTLEEGSRLSGAGARDEFSLPADEEQLDELAAAEALLAGAGYDRYEISNYALTGFECNHNLSCWRGGEYIGIGPAAASHAGLKRRCNRPDIILYMEALESGENPPFDEETLTPRIKQAERLVFGLRMAEGVDMELSPECLSTLISLRSDGLVVCNGHRWMLTARGRNLADYVGSELITCD